jgi:hypothetical protein
MNFNDFWAMFFVACFVAFVLYFALTGLLNLFYKFTHYD